MSIQGVSVCQGVPCMVCFELRVSSLEECAYGYRYNAQFFSAFILDFGYTTLCYIMLVLIRI